MTRFWVKNNEVIPWSSFDTDMPWEVCSIFGIALSLSVQDNITNGEVLLGSGTGHYKEEKAGIAVVKPS